MPRLLEPTGGPPAPVGGSGGGTDAIVLLAARPGRAHVALRAQYAELLRLVSGPLAAIVKTRGGAGERGERAAQRGRVVGRHEQHAAGLLRHREPPSARGVHLEPVLGARGGVARGEARAHRLRELALIAGAVPGRGPYEQ